MSIRDYLESPEMKFFAGSTAIIIAAVAIITSVSDSSGSNDDFSQILTIGPVWNDDGWRCTSDKDFVVHATIRGLRDSQLSIRVSNLGTQSLYDFSAGEFETFTVGAKGGEAITLIRTGVVSGWVTLQTTSDAMASCNSGDF